MKKILLLSAFLFIIIIGCSSAPESIDQNQVTFLTNGVWLGKLPCDDCEGIDYTLNLKNDFTFKQISVYKGKGEEFLIDEGNWIFDSDSVIELESSDYGKKFLISGKELILLDEWGERIESSSEHNYRLRKDEKEVKNIEVVKEVVEMNPVIYGEKFTKGIDFFARGNEPFWTLEIDLEKEMNFATLDDIKLNLSAVEEKKAQDSDVITYRAKTKSGELLVTVTKVNCQDNMSGEKFNYKVKVEAKNTEDKEFKTFEGCGKYLYDTRLRDIWVLEDMTGIKLKKVKLSKGLPTFEFYPDEMRFGGHAGCNSLSSSINVIGNKITFGNLIGTLTACPDMTVEKAVVKAIDQKTVTYSIDKMKLTLVSGKTKMVFKKVD
ncbi:MAG: copper resistance protein NlpE N-terminal domain-containing protein [Ignavibacteria bacterium]|nr:copper resistance protein NlpE N-terminal domain-containing protein [Ignavibacteria bacterium]